jgi:hypothetical protein
MQNEGQTAFGVEIQVVSLAIQPCASSLRLLLPSISVSENIIILPGN